MTKRQGWAASLRALNLARQSADVDAWASALMLPLLYFFRRRVVDETTDRADAQAGLKGFHLVPLSPEILGSALRSTGPDLEDNVKLASAESMAVNHLITRNKKDFQSSAISVLTPEEWLAIDEVARLEANLPK